MDQTPEPSLQIDSTPTVDRPARPAERSRITQRLDIHSGLPELIHALGPEPAEELLDLDSSIPIAVASSLPQRFEAYLTPDNFLKIEKLMVDLLRHSAYQVKPVRGDLLATRLEERLFIRALPWDGTYSTVGRRTIERFADEFKKSDANDGICISEAAMPPIARELEASDSNLWFVGRGRLPRLLELFDAVIALGYTDSLEDQD